MFPMPGAGEVPLGGHVELGVVPYDTKKAFDPHMYAQPRHPPNKPVLSSSRDRRNTYIYQHLHVLHNVGNILDFGARSGAAELQIPRFDVAEAPDELVLLRISELLVFLEIVFVQLGGVLRHAL